MQQKDSPFIKFFMHFFGQIYFKNNMKIINTSQYYLNVINFNKI